MGAATSVEQVDDVARGMPPASTSVAERLSIGEWPLVIR
jgi:hypothetical protein